MQPLFEMFHFGGNLIELIAKRSADYCPTNTIVSVTASACLEMFDMA